MRKWFLLSVLCLSSCTSTNTSQKTVLGLPKTSKIQLSWDNASLTNSIQYETGIEASTDLKNWTQIVVLPYTNKCNWTFVGTNNYMFFRAFNRIK